MFDHISKTLMYLDKNYFPIDLFNKHYDIEFANFETIKKFTKAIQKNTKFDFDKTFIENKRDTLFANALTHFSFVFFLQDNSVDSIRLQNLFTSNSRIVDLERLSKLYDLRIDINMIIQTLNKIDKLQDCEVDKTSFITELFILLYKYAFVEISNSIIISSIGYSISDYIDDYLSTEKKDKKKVSKHALAARQLIGQTISEDSSLVTKTMFEIQIFTKNSLTAKYLYAVIERNIKLSSMSSSKKNKLLRPLFNEIICQICYPSYYFKDDSDNPKIVDRYRNFLKEINRY